ncbi:MAG: hypothetical protein WC337_11775 [Candidatus Muiribacteriota bacterium]|jgi:hypothetical protein
MKEFTESFKTRLKTAPKNVSSYVDIKNIYKKNGQEEKAINCLNKLYCMTGDKQFLNEIKELQCKNYFKLLDKFSQKSSE